MVYQELRIDRLNGLLIVPNRHRQIRILVIEHLRSGHAGERRWKSTGTSVGHCGTTRATAVGSARCAPLAGSDASRQRFHRADSGSSRDPRGLGRQREHQPCLNLRARHPDARPTVLKGELSMSDDYSPADRRQPYSDRADPRGAMLKRTMSGAKS